jgi:hypothetical protein
MEEEDPIEPADDDEALEWVASTRTYEIGCKIREMKLQLKQLQIEFNRWEYYHRSLLDMRMQRERIRNDIIRHIE